MAGLADTLDRLNRGIALVVRWTAIAMVVIQFAIVIGRYVYGLNSIAVQESVLYLHAALFMLAVHRNIADDLQ